MDLVAEMLLGSLATRAVDVSATGVCPSFRRRFSRSGTGPGTPGSRLTRLGFTLDRGLNRFVDYPRHVRALHDRFDVFHVVDHAYAHLVHALPAERTIVTCHDLHTFQSVLRPDRNRRSRTFQRMTRHVLAGLAKAARIVVDASPVRDDLVRHGIAPAERIDVVHLGVQPVFFEATDPASEAELEGLLGASDGRTELLHVGGTFARKRIDLVLRIFAGLREVRPDARLIRVGGPLTAEQTALAERLGVMDAVVTLPFIRPAVLAAVYRRASLVLLPSEEEGFGFPVLESLASGTPIVASDLPVLREVGGDAAVFSAVGAVSGWVDTIEALLRERETRPDAWAARRERGRKHAARFTWDEYATKMIHIYQGVVSE